MYLKVDSIIRSIEHSRDVRIQNMHIKGKHAQHIKTIFNFILNEKIKMKHGLLWDYHRFILHELVDYTIGYIIEVFTPHKYSQLLFKLVFCYNSQIPFK